MRDFFRRNLGLKLISLIIAVWLEIYFMSPQNMVVETISAAVELQGLGDGYMVVWPPAAEEGLLAACKVRGPGPLVQEIRDTPRKFTITIPPKPPENFVGLLNASQLGLPSGVELVEVQPPRFEFRIEPIIEKQLPVKISLSGNSPAGFRVDSIKVAPQTVVVRGPEGEINALAELETEKIDISQYKEPVSLDVVLKGIGGRAVFRRRTVRIDLAVSPILTDKIFQNVRVVVKAPAGFAASVMPTRTQAILTGDEKAVNSVSELTLQAVADLSGFALPEGKRFIEKINLTVPDLPRGVRLLATNPQQVEVTLVRKGR